MSWKLRAKAQWIPARRYVLRPCLLLPWRGTYQKQCLASWHTQRTWLCQSIRMFFIGGLVSNAGISLRIFQRSRASKCSKWSQGRPPGRSLPCRASSQWVWEATREAVWPYLVSCKPVFDLRCDTANTGAISTGSKSWECAGLGRQMSAAHHCCSLLWQRRRSHS